MKLFTNQVEIILKSGRSIFVRANDMKWELDRGTITGLQWDNASGPRYIQLSDIAVIFHQRVLNWRRLFR